jgi:hypothetical protein
MRKELKATTENILPFKKDAEKANRKGLGKRWKTALTLSPGCVERDKNYAVESMYNQILKLAKTLHFASKDRWSDSVFERCYKEDNSENCFALHSFLTPTFYWYLECDFAYFYKINYSFNNCPYEEELMFRISRWLDYIPNRIECVKLKPSHSEFYKKVLTVQDQQYIILLNENTKQSS